ncbi:MAG: sugar phosphate isomerase/epimerase [Planctomycetes bacterium]|nr:sugar phosphate isomerase/epimerase [Planctomycetota bacterium]
MEISQIAVSPCSNPEMDLDAVLEAYSSIGYENFEVFTGWANSAFDYHSNPARYLEKGKEYGMNFISLHLPPMQGDDMRDSLAEAVEAARFAEAIGAEIVLYKADARSTYIEAAPSFLDAIEELDITPVIQNHFGTPLTSLEDVKEVWEGIDDPRMRALLEVGHFHSAGVHWLDAAEYLGDGIALVHIKDQIGQQSVPFGGGEIDLPGLFERMDSEDYGGYYVVEMEVEDEENTLTYLSDAYRYMRQHCRR